MWLRAQARWRLIVNIPGGLFMTVECSIVQGIVRPSLFHAAEVLQMTPGGSLLSPLEGFTKVGARVTAAGAGRQPEKDARRSVIFGVRPPSTSVLCRPSKQRLFQDAPCTN